MVQLEVSGSEQKIQALRNRLQGEDHELQHQEEDRRRPGRADHVNPALVPLLRGEVEADMMVSDKLDLSHGLERKPPMLGIAVGVILSIPLWGVLGLVAWVALR